MSVKLDLDELNRGKLVLDDGREARYQHGKAALLSKLKSLNDGCIFKIKEEELNNGLLPAQPHRLVECYTEIIFEKGHPSPTELTRLQKELQSEYHGRITLFEHYSNYEWGGSRAPFAGLVPEYDKTRSKN